HAPLPGRLREALPDRLDQPQALVRDDQPNPLHSAGLQVQEEGSPPLGVFFPTLGHTEDCPVPVPPDPDGHQDRDVLHLRPHDRFNQIPSRNTYGYSPSIGRFRHVSNGPYTFWFSS